MAGRHRKVEKISSDSSDEEEFSGSETDDSEPDTGALECIRSCCETFTKPVGRCIGRCCGYGYSENLPEDSPLGGREKFLGHLGKIARLVYGQGYTNDEFYGKLDPPFGGEGWKVVDQVVEASGSGVSIQAGCYMRVENDDDNVAIVAFRGTSSKAGGQQCADLRIIKGHFIKKAVREGRAFYKKIQAAFPDKEIFVTGHSLGGYIAEAVASYEDVPGVSWNSPGPWHTSAIRNHTGKYRPNYEVHLTREDPLSLIFPKPENSSHICAPIWHPGKSHRICKPYMCKVENMQGVHINTLPIDRELVVDQREALQDMFGSISLRSMAINRLEAHAE